jgi:next-to-BRCA1 protein 1
LHHKNRVWTNALLRFSVLDATPHKTPCIAPETTTTPAQPLMSDIWSTQGSTVSAGLPFIGAGGAQPPPLRPISLSHLPAPIFSTPPRAFTQTPMSVETTPLNHFTEPFFPSFSYGQSVQSQPTPDTQSMSSCCSIAQGKTEVQNLISDFQRNLNDLLTKTFGPQSMSDSQNKPTISLTPPYQPFWLRPVLCVSCHKNVEGSRQFTCENCRTILVSWMLHFVGCD